MIDKTIHKFFRLEHVLLWIKFSVFSVLIGRGIQMIFYEGPFRSLIYDQYFIGRIGSWLTGESFDEFQQNDEVRKLAENVDDVVGCFFVLTAVMVVFFIKRSWVQYFLWSSFVLLLLTSIGFWKSKFLAFGLLFEYAAQTSVPLLLYYFLKKPVSARLLITIKAIVSVTFICHGLFAIGYYPIPGNFVEMVIKTFECSNEFAIGFLKMMGFLDFLFAACLWIRKIESISLWYCLIWGFATSLARIWTNWYPDNLEMTLAYYLPEFIVRIPHFLLPMILLIYVMNKSEEVLLEGSK